MLISNTINDKIDISLYDFDYDLAMAISNEIIKIDLNMNIEPEYVECVERHRNKQTKELLERLKNSLTECKHQEWLLKRGIPPNNAYSIDYNYITLQDMLDLYILPSDFILDKYGTIPIEGPVFADTRNGNLVGICIRNITKDQNYASDEKYTFSNFGWFLYGYDLYDPDDEVFIVEGVFDAIIMRKSGYNAIGIAAACPNGIQLACLMHKFDKINLCLDNDLYGRMGSHVANKVLGFPIYQTELKDPGSYHHTMVEMKLCDPVDVEKQLLEEIEEYNKSPKKDRELPYN